MSEAVKAILPLCWTDDTEMNLMFEKFGSESSSTFEHKIKFWSTLITKFCSMTNTVEFSAQDMSKSFERNGCTPECLETVMDHMASVGLIVPLVEYSSSVEKYPVNTKSWLGHIYNLFKPFLSAFWERIVSSKKDERYVFISLIKAISLDILTCLKQQMGPGYTSRFVFMKEVMDQLKDITSEMNIQLSLVQLQSDKELILWNFEGHGVLKLRCEGEPSVGPITDEDRHITRLLKTRWVLEADIKQANQYITRLTDQADNFSNTGQKFMALIYINRKRLAEKHLDTGRSMLVIINEALDSVENAAKQRMMLSRAEAIQHAVSRPVDPVGNNFPHPEAEQEGLLATCGVQHM